MGLLVMAEARAVAAALFSSCELRGGRCLRLRVDLAPNIRSSPLSVINFLTGSVLSL